MNISEYKKLTPKKRVMHESLEQQDVIKWANMSLGKYPDLEWLYAVPNGHGIFIATRINMVKEGLKSGITDLVLPCARRGYYDLYIEMKWGDNKLDDNQIRFMNYLGANNRCGITCWSAEAAINTLKWYLDGPPTKRVKDEL